MMNGAYECEFSQARIGDFFLYEGEEYLKSYDAESRGNLCAVEIPNGNIWRFFPDARIVVLPEAKLVYPPVVDIKQGARIEFERLADDMRNDWCKMVDEYNRKFRAIQEKYCQEGKRQEEVRKFQEKMEE